MTIRHLLLLAGASLGALAISGAGVGAPARPNAPAAQLSDNSNGADWPGFGRTFGEQHYSPLTQVDGKTVSRLGLAWSLDLPSENTATQPIEVGGVIYFASGLSKVHAVDAVTGRTLWVYDPGVAVKAGRNLRTGWGVKGIAWWNGQIFVGTQDSRLVAVNARTGKLAWSVQAFDPSLPLQINGAPRMFDGKVIIGFASTKGASRGAVATYDAATGKELWRFYVTPDDPAKEKNDPTMAMAAKTWAGEWWRFGGGGDVWNAMAYDPETHSVIIGTGSGYPWNRRARSADTGDNLFLSSIVALDARTGAYKWHYQVNPGETWDYDAAMDIELADMVIDGKPRKVLLHAPKNGFFYVIDRLTGKLISAEPYAKVTWATGIDRATGRPIETPDARYPDGKTVEIWPSPTGAHAWQPMAYSPRTGLAYIPQIEMGAYYTDKGVDLKNWRPPADWAQEGALGRPEVKTQGDAKPIPGKAHGNLIAWDPKTQKPVWTVPLPTHFNGGLLATGGDLVFQGTVDGTFKAYAAKTGGQLWSFDAKAPILSAPITFTVKGRQYVTILTGTGMAFSSGAAYFLGEDVQQRYGLDSRSQARRVLTFALDGKGSLPPRKAAAPFITDPDFVEDKASASQGEGAFGRYCASCHGSLAVGASIAPDLRRSAVVLSAGAFYGVVHEGALTPKGMPRFDDLDRDRLEAIRQYLRTRAHNSR